MLQTQPRRRLILMSLLVLTLAATAWVGTREEATDLTDTPSDRHHATPPSSSARNADKSELLKLDKSERLLGRAGSNNPFASKSWYVPPPPPKMQPPPPPSAPPLPFVYMGKLIEEGQVIVFLSRQDRSYAVKAGDIIDSTYRAEEIGPSSITFTYLPMKTKQTLAIGDRN